MDYLGDLGLLAYGYDLVGPDDGLELRGHDRDRVRLIKRTSISPEGIYLPTLASECAKGQYIGQCERFDGSDPNYQFVYRFLDDLGRHDPQLIEKCQSDGVTIVTPTIRLLNLILEGITQTIRERDDLLYDRHFCKNYLKTANKVDGWGRDLLEDSLHRYLKHIENYQLLFDIHFCRRRSGSTTRRMTKQYNTRFNSQGRLRKTWARYNSALGHAYEKYDNAVLMTPTTDPGTYDDPTRPDLCSLYGGISSINPSFNRLLSYFDSDPSTKDDTRRDGIPSWSPALDGKVTGRPRYRPPYPKVLEFTEKGCAHLHILMFDVPTREGDGMPFLIDKVELERKWKGYGQGQIVDLYPLVLREDLGEVGGSGTKTLVDDDGDQLEVPVSKELVSWYRYGSHDHSDERIVKNARPHDLTESYNDESDEDGDKRVQSRTAGAYLGKYLSTTFGSLLEASESFEDAKEPDSYIDKATTRKLGLYWATGRRFWSISRGIEKVIERPEHLQDPNVRHAVRELSIDSLQFACDGATVEELALDDVVTPGVESTLPGSADFYCHIDYLGCYAYWDMPAADTTATNLEHVEDYVASGGQPEYPDVGDEKPSPVTDVWG